MPNANTYDDRALREIWGELSRMKDTVLSSMLGRTEPLTTSQMQKVLNDLNTWKREGIGNQLEEIVSRYAGYSFDAAADSVDLMLKGEDLADVLNVTPETLGKAQSYIANKIITIPEALHADVSQQLALAHVGGHTPAEMAERISANFDLAYWQASRIVKTENGYMTNRATSERIDQLEPAMKERGIEYEKIWSHSTQKKSGGGHGKKKAMYKPRLGHMHANGQKAVDGVFTIEGIDGDVYRPKAPHDSDALPPEEIINCGCLLLLRLKR